MKEKYKHIEKLLERFFEGYTLNTEEQQLYDFFAGKDVPDHLQPYKPLFTCFEVFPEAFCEKVPPVCKRQYGKWMLWPGVAAALLVLVLLNPFGSGDKPFDPYAGSYIVYNGVRITDPEIILWIWKNIYRSIMMRYLNIFRTKMFGKKFGKY
jgi:hypothetical protein